MSNIQDMNMTSERTPKKRRSLQRSTRRPLRNRTVHGGEGSEDSQADYFKTTVGKRRASITARATIHPATRLASVAKNMEVSDSFQVSTSDRLLEELQTLTSPRKRDLHADSSSRERRNERHSRSNTELIDRASRVTSRRSSGKAFRERTLRPRYPRTPTPETAILLSPKLSKARQLRTSTPKPFRIPKEADEKVSSASSGIPTALRSATSSPITRTPKSRLLKSQKVSTTKSSTPKKEPTAQTPKSSHRSSTLKKSTTQTPKSSHKGTPKSERTPRAKTPKGTSKSQKKEHSLVCQTCEETLPEKKAMLRHQRLHGRSKIDCKNLTPNKATLIRAQTSKNRSTKFECDICRKTFRFSSNLRSHKAIHGEQRSFECQLCQKSLLITSLKDGGFIIQPSLVEKSENLEQVNVRNCSHSNNHPGDSQKHVPKKERTKKLMCDKCARTFVLESNLKIHMKTHTIDKLRDILKASASVFAAE